MTNTRTGIGYDVHRFSEDRPLILGGVTVPFEKGLAGHSDADVLLHAIMDALLGAAALGDIGIHFPPGDDRFFNASSLTLLADVASMLISNSYQVVNIDSTLIVEAPRISPHTPKMRATIADVLNIQSSQVNIKATTNEGMGFIGRSEGIAALSICTLVGSAGEKT
ncbi:2-C-methyl-D-erythritol 2,4-cyclodiphosphate synthase [soil metagenome]